MLRDAKDHLRFILEDLTPAQIARTLVECVFGGKPDCEGIGREWGRGAGVSLPRHKLVDQRQ